MRFGARAAANQNLHPYRTFFLVPHWYDQLSMFVSFWHDSTPKASKPAQKAKPRPELPKKQMSTKKKALVQGPDALSIPSSFPKKLSKKKQKKRQKTIFAISNIAFLCFSFVGFSKRFINLQLNTSQKHWIHVGSSIPNRKLTFKPLAPSMRGYRKRKIPGPTRGIVGYQKISKQHPSECWHRTF